MKRDRFKVIKGGGGKPAIPRYRFKRSFVTNTRLMGVVGMKIFWETEDGKSYTQFFHLDFEEYGIDGFESLVDGTQEDIDIITSKMMGGLGGKFVRISKKESIYLLIESFKVNVKNNESLCQGVEEFEFLLKSQPNIDEEKLWNKMCEKIVNDYQLINYFMMRAVGADKKGQKFLCLDDNAKKFNPTDKSLTLIKNIIKKSYSNGSINYYSVKALIDLDKGYQLIICNIGVKQTQDGLKVAYAEINDKMKISPIEAAFQLKKPEYILIYSTKEFIELVEILDADKPKATQNIHQTGFLYTEFNPNNDHVKNPVYYLNGDIFAVYFVTTENQLAVSTFSKENLVKLKKYFSGRVFQGLLEIEGEFKTDNPLLYEFVHSGYEDFFDFLNNV
ncbi:hypothetical protein [Paramaledivibacter caminithermalis]|jgi:hypothetical protein|uniref:Uncharacterized protein n=1 Tax=Paramaledivibacter caminithermalis (strain DSM 15212 / CIP 107654 / DViRD3) TaxID=1121301 RepID=A0A1M6L4P2_PARC5|nr:hypothetical protein [Paramaledivibacter caminithermalis]SHJ66084.1 hypothetical protein SAMN02745912_00646 [Paramaledivibacter caminithermalis DSM 15212]